MSRESGRGFSLIGLLAFLAIFAVTLSFGYPRLAALVTTYRLSGATWNVAAALNKARSQAVAESKRVQVSFDATTRSYRVCKEDDASAFTVCDTAKAIDGANTIALSATASAIFSARGVCEQTTVVMLRAVDGAQRLVGVRRTGVVYVF
jgi:Tfp pilus assembly protein FimT